MRMRGFIRFPALIGLSLLAAAPALAQDRATIDRLDRLERDMNMLQRQVYRGGGSGGPAVVTPADPNAAVNAELRMDQIETQMRSLTGQIEELNYSINQ